MTLLLRLGLPGLVSGLVSGTLLAIAFDHVWVGLAVGALSGTAYALALPHSLSAEGAAVDRAMTAAALGLPMWGAINVIALPLLAGQPAQWTAEGMRAVFPALVSWLTFGFVLGLLTTGATTLVERFVGKLPAK